MTMTPRDRVLAALRQEKLDRPPVATFTTCDTIGMMKASGAYWPEAHSDPKKMATLGCAQADYFGLESVRVGFCLTQEAEVFGCKVNIGTATSSPMIKEHPFHYDAQKKIYDEIDFPDIDSFIESGRVKTTIEAIKIMQKTHGEDYVVVGGTTGPFTVTGHLLNTENLVYSVWSDPDMAQKWVNAVAPYCKAFGNALLEAGADVVQMSEPSASADILSPDDFSKHSGQYVKHSLGDLNGKTILHVCGDTSKIIPHMYDTGVTGISIEEKVDPYKAVEIAKGRGALVGNVGCAFPLFRGTPADVEVSTKRCRDAGFDVISAGCGVPIGTPDENIRAMVRAIKG